MFAKPLPVFGDQAVQDMLPLDRCGDVDDLARLLCSEDGGKTWIDVRFDFDETRWPPIDGPDYQSLDQQEPGFEPADSYPLATQHGRDFHTEILQADETELEGAGGRRLKHRHLRH